MRPGLAHGKSGQVLSPWVAIPIKPASSVVSRSTGTYPCVRPLVLVGMVIPSSFEDDSSERAPDVSHPTCGLMVPCHGFVPPRLVMVGHLCEVGAVATDQNLSFAVQSSHVCVGWYHYGGPWSPSGVFHLTQPPSHHTSLFWDRHHQGLVPDGGFSVWDLVGSSHTLCLLVSAIFLPALD